MENRVGDVVPSESEAMKLLAEVEALAKKIDKYGEALTQDERQRTLKPPVGSEAVTLLIAKLLEKHDVALPGLSAEDMRADLTLAQRLLPVAEALSALERKVQDVILQANHERWAATTAGYTALGRVMGASPALENEMRPALDLFGAGRKRKPKAAKPA